MTNPLKGEIQLTIGDTDYSARLTLDSIMQIEQSVGCGIIKLAQRMGEADIRVTDLVNVLTPALRGGGNDFKPKKIQSIIADVGLIAAASAVAELLTMTIVHQDEASTDDSDEDSAGDAKKKDD